MLLTIAVLLLLLWAVGMIVKVTGALIHVLLLLAIAVAIFHFVRGKNVV
jgi:hypothetical protein